ncbi:MAG: bile acid:sodium symporter family protein [Phaeodactylibacter sp.]|nr:bile acid:sodium symporter family protein [Phaeodactylibacter sp.]MCB9293981.1 bile acid:sodium symporter family protein [Lewinellaceae bacterium]
MQAIDSVQINFNPGQLFILNICLAFLMFGVALDLRFDNFRALARSPRAPLVGLSSQLILLPALTLALIFFFRPAPSIALGMVLVAACPGGNVSNFAVHLANANAALSVLMTSISTLAAIVVTPLYFTYLAPFVPGAENLRQQVRVDPLDMVNTIVQLILIPLFIGMFLNYRYPVVTARLKKPVRLLSMAIFLSFVVVAVYGNFDNIVNYLHVVFLIVLVHNATALFAGYWWAKSHGLGRQDARAISIETGIQNSGLGLILIFNFFNGLGGMAMIAAWWGVWHLISAFGLAMLWRERSVLSVE